MIVAVDTHCILPGAEGGVENYTLGLIESLKSPDSPAAQLVLLTRPENHNLFSRFADSRTIAVRSDPNQNANVLRLHRVDLLHCPGNTINLPSFAIPVVLNLHDLKHLRFPECFTQDELADREKWWPASAHRADAVIVPSNYAREDLHHQFGIASSKVFVTPEPFNQAFCVTPSEAKLAALRAQFALPETFFIYPADCSPHKNHERFIRAFLSADLPGVQLILTGEGQSVSKLPAMVSGLGVSDRVRLLGRVQDDELIGLYHLATAMIFPSEYESWSISIMEAMACGCPIACANVTSLPEQIGNVGLMFAPDDVTKMAAAMKELAGDRLLRRALAFRGKQRVQKFDRDSFLTTIAAAYTYAQQSFFTRKAA